VSLLLEFCTLFLWLLLTLLVFDNISKIVLGFRFEMVGSDVGWCVGRNTLEVAKSPQFPFFP
jgi:hypothetical protein